jgi:hypothetical protein
MRTITDVRAHDDWTLDIAFNDGEERRFDVKPLLDLEAFTPLRNIDTFKKIHNGGYFVEWDNEADLSADTLYLEGASIKQE